MPLPIIRLEKTSVNNATQTEDPLRATATLYSFLHSVTSEAEINLAMSDFRASLQRRRRQDMEAARVAGAQRPEELHSGGGLPAWWLTPAEEAIRQRIEAAVVDKVLQRPALISPEWCRRTSRWRELFRPPPSASALDADTTVTPASSAPPSATSGEERLLVQTAALKQYMNPYETYNESHGVEKDAQRWAHHESPEVSGTDEVDNIAGALPSDKKEEECEEDAAVAALQHSGSTQAPETTGESAEESTFREELGDSGRDRHLAALSSDATDSNRGAADAFLPSSVDSETVSDEPSVLSVDRAGAVEPDEGAMPELCPTAAAEGAVHHPLLSLIAHQAGAQQQQQQQADTLLGTNGPQANAQASALLQRCREVQARLAAARSEAVSAMQAYEAQAGNSIWAPAFTYMKNGASYIAELQERAQAAENLLRVEAYEQETIEAAQIALLMEVMSMKLLLRDVQRAVDDAAAEHLEAHLQEDERLHGDEGSHKGTTAAKTMDAALMADLISVLAPFAEGDGE